MQHVNGMRIQSRTLCSRRHACDAANDVLGRTGVLAAIVAAAANSV